MNKRLVLTISISLLVLAAGLFFLLQKEQRSEPKTSGDQQAELKKRVQKKQFKELIELEKKSPGTVEKLIKFASPKMAAMDAMGKAMNASFQFYGKIIDQHGEAVAGVKVVYSMGGFGSFGQPFSKVNRTQSDSNGAFTFFGESTSFSFRSMSKTGYEFVTPSSFYTYPQHEGMKLKYKGTPDKPVLIHAWKKGEIAKLIFENSYYGFTPDNQIYTVDLHKRQKHIGPHSGDITVSFWRDPEGTHNNPSDWKFIITAIDGGLIETNDDYMNEAPESSYKKSVVIGSSKSDEIFLRDIQNKRFYIKSRGGKSYARVEMRFLPYQKKLGVIHIRSWANPTGSRNLQRSESEIGRGY